MSDFARTSSRKPPGATRKAAPGCARPRPYRASASRLLAALLFCAILFTAAGAVAATQQESLQDAIRHFEALTLDTQKGMRRDAWEEIESRFATIAKQGSGYAPEALFYQARSREELADRSKRKSDWQEAARLYSDFVSSHKKHPLADNAAYNRATILSGPLDDKAGAARALDELIAAYPGGDASAGAGILRQSLVPGHPAGRAAPPARSAPAPASTPVPRASLERQKNIYAAAAAEWRALLADDKRAGLRESWLKLEKSFTDALEAAPAGEEAHKASFQIARAREELARRSTRKSDWREAADLFAATAKTYPESSLADDSLYARAEILAGRLAEPAGAANDLNALLSRYPGGDAVPKARKLLTELPARAKPAEARAPSQSQPASSARKISGSSGSHTVKEPSRGAILRHLEWSGDAESLTLTLELAGKAKYRRSTLPADPNRRLPQRVRLDLIACEAYSGLRQNIALSGAPLSAVSLAKTGDAARVELDLAGARSYKVTVLRDPYRLQVEIQTTRLIPGGEDLDKIKPVSGAERGAGRAADGNIVEQLGLSIKTIMIDAGHGGKDPGAIGNRLRESTVVLDLAKKLGAELGKKGFTVLYTRGNDSFVELEDRISLANSKRADVFVSIHVNSSTNKGLHGLETYYLDVASSNAARVVAARENAVNIGTASDLQFILSDLTRNAKKEESLALAGQVQNACVKRLGQAGFTVRSNGVRSAPFYVLMGARMPAFLIEIGYLSNKAEADRIKSAKYIQAIAGGITDGIVAYQKQLNRLGR